MKPFHLSVALVIAAAALSFSTSREIFAADAPQTQPARTDGPTGLLSRVKQAASSVKLTDEQKKKLDGMFQRAGNDLKSTADKFKDDAQARAKEAQAVLNRLQHDMGNLLNDDQKEEFKKRFQSLSGAPGFLDRFANQLKSMDLSEEQKKKIDQIMADARTQFEQLRDQARSGSQEAREKLVDLFTDTLKKMEGVLNDEQLKKLRDSLKSAGGQSEPATRQDK
jgi:Spy/CpxP family protein refolding chaperone